MKATLYTMGERDGFNLGFDFQTEQARTPSVFVVRVPALRSGASFVAGNRVMRGSLKTDGLFHPERLNIFVLNFQLDAERRANIRALH